MLISVVLTFYNQRIYVRRALKSVLQQTHAELDIIVVDDGSDENIESRVHEFSDDRVRFFRKENGGVSSARNFGIEKAHGMYIAFLDGDDGYLPGRIKTMLEFLRQNGYHICLATSGAYIYVKNGHFIGRVRPHDYPVGDIINSSLVRPSCTMYHCNVFTRLGGFPEHLKSNEDGALNSIAAQFFPIYSVDQSLVLYQSDNSGLARRDLDIFDNAVKVMKQRLEYVLPYLSHQKKLIYKNQSYRNLLFGFLSVSNMNAAKQWLKILDSKKLRGVVGWIALLSAFSGINVYNILRLLRISITSLFLLPCRIKLRGLLKL